MTLPPNRITILLVAASTIATMIACRNAHDRNGAARADTSIADGEPVDLYHAVCDGKRYCDDFDSLHPERFFDAIVGITSCQSDGEAALFGSWRVGDAESRPFEWTAHVRRGGVFPSLGYTATSLDCGIYRPQAPLANVIVALDPDGFAWAKLQGDDVFIPLGGEATIDHEFHASALLEQGSDASTARITVSVEGPHDARTVHRGLGRGDRFPWGDDGATVVRLVDRQDGLLGAIGWVEIALSVEGPRARDR